MNKTRRYILLGLACAIAVTAIVFTGIRRWRSVDTSMTGIPLRCAIELRDAADIFPGLTVGLNYEMLQDYSSAHNDSLVSIVLSSKGESYLDSLIQGSVDVVVVPFNDTLRMDGISFSRPVEGLTMWAIRSEYTDGLTMLNEWMDKYTSTDEYNERRDCFLLRYSPSRRAANGRKVSAISPYDDLVKKYAGELGWDWRLLSSIIYQESKFHIEVSSSRGASGLMQMMPATASYFGVSDLLDPEENIKAGVSLLNNLQGRMGIYTEDPEELRKFVLAAYNAGRQRIVDCISFARYKGMDSTKWEEVASVIPEMSDDSIMQLDTVKLGKFNGTQTMKYVQGVLSHYEDFKQICP